MKVLLIENNALYLHIINIFFYMEKLNRIKEVLESRGTTQTWLAKQLGCHFSTVNAYCSQRLQPSLNTLAEISKILNVDLKDLITDKEEREINN